MANMTKSLSRGEIQDLLTKFATDNPRYRDALLKDPKAIIEKQLNTSLGSVKVKAVADTADTIHVVVPYVASEGELSDADLEKVAGGKQDKIDAKCEAAAGAIMTTVTEINI